MSSWLDFGFHWTWKSWKMTLSHLWIVQYVVQNQNTVIVSVRRNAGVMTDPPPNREVFCLNVCRLHVNWWSWRVTWSVQRSVLRWPRRKLTSAPWKLTPTQEPLCIIHVVIGVIMCSLLWQHVVLHIHLSLMNFFLTVYVDSSGSSKCCMDSSQSSHNNSLHN